MKYYRVKTGYGADDFLSVDENEVAQAIRAQVNGGVAIFKEGTVSGNHIMSITPDYNRVLGYNRDYHLTGEDYDELPSGSKNEHMRFLQEKQHEALEAPQLKRLT